MDDGLYDRCPDSTHSAVGLTTDLSSANGKQNIDKEIETDRALFN